MQTKLTYQLVLFLVIGIFLSFYGCKRLVEVGAPVTSESSANVFSEDASAIGAVTGLYGQMAQGSLQYGTTLNAFMMLYPELSADELSLYASTGMGLDQYYQNNLTNMVVPNIWTTIYSFIYQINSAIDGLSASSSLTPAVKTQLLGEVKFLRAYHYFYLINLYGDAPLVLSVDYTLTQKYARTAQNLVYAQIIQDLQDARSLLSDKFLDGTLLNTSADRVRPSQGAALALLARVYLYTGNYVGADSAASALIADSSVFKLGTLDNAFLMASLGNNEAIWQLQSINKRWNTQDAQFFVLPSTGPNAQWPAYLNKQLLKSFEPGDQRRYHWIDSVIVAPSDTFYFPYKYKNNTFDSTFTEYEVQLRLGEQFLIRAEARAHGAGTGISGAVDDLDRIRGRAGLSAYAGDMGQTDVLNAIFKERRSELFVEMGHRWLDLKRSGRIDSVMTVANPLKGGPGWISTQQLYPLPAADLQYDQYLIQNPGY